MYVFFILLTKIDYYKGGYEYRYDNIIPTP